MSEQERKLTVLMIGQKLEGRKFVCCSKFGFLQNFLRFSYDRFSGKSDQGSMLQNLQNFFVRNLQIFVASKGVLELA